MSVAHLGTLVLLLLIAVATLNPLSAADPVFLKTSSSTIRNKSGTGDVVQLRGVNLGGWLLFEAWQTPLDSNGDAWNRTLADDWTARDLMTRHFGDATSESLIADYQNTWITSADIDNIAAMGMNVIRLPFWYRNLENEDGTVQYSDAVAFGRMDWLVSEAAKRGIYTILDYHGTPGGQSGSDTTGRKRGGNGLLWTTAAYQTRSVNILKRVAKHFKGNPWVAGYDLLNEPIGASGAAQWNIDDLFYHAVRDADKGNDPDHIVFIEAVWDYKNLPTTTLHGWTNVVYEFHQYWWDDQSFAGQQQPLQDKVNDWTAKRGTAGWNTPYFMGEFSFFGDKQSWKFALPKMNDAGMCWTSWTYKATFGDSETSWGLYNPKPGNTALRPTLWNGTDTTATGCDSAATVSTKWKTWKTADAFAINPMLRDTLAIPIAKNDSGLSVVAGQTVSIPFATLLANDTSLNADRVLTVDSWSAPVHGTLTVSGTSLVYNPNGFTSGADTFTYRTKDTNLSAVSNNQATVTITVTPALSQVVAPTFSPTAGTYVGPQIVAISSATSGATIYYTIDGSTPTTASPVYSASLTISTTTTVKALAVKTGMTASAGVSATFTINPLPTVGAPTFSPGAGTYVGPQAVALSSATSGATIYYTIDGSTPSTASPVYTAALTISTTTTVKALAVKTGMTASAGVSATFTINPLPTVGAPTFSPGAGTYVGPQAVALSSTTSGATIYYTIDGSTPTTASPVYTASLTISTTTTVKALAVKTGMTASAVVSATFTINPLPKAGAPTFSPAQGNFTDSQAVTLSSTTTGATIYYTTTGATPTTASSIYAGPVLISATTTLRAIAVKTGMTDSSVITGIFTITPLSQVIVPVFSPLPDTYADGQTVTLTSGTAGTAIYYTTNGSPPTTASPEYTAPFAINATTTVQAFATKPGMTDSVVTSGTFTILPVATPTFSLPAGTYAEAQTLALSCATSAATIRYTTDGSTPTATSALSTAPLILTETTTVKAIASKSGRVASEIASRTFVISGSVPITMPPITSSEGGGGGGSCGMGSLAAVLGLLLFFLMHAHVSSHPLTRDE